MSAAAPAGSRWALVLAGGDGQRMDPFVRRWLGEPKPKQYCAFTGGRTMIEHTLSRALDAVPAERAVTVINSDHRRFLDEPRRLDLPGRIVEQPARRDTGPGVFLPLTFVTSRDPEAVVAIMPSDHFIHPRARFAELLDEAYALAEFLPGQLVLLSARAERAEREYGWISPGRRLAGGNARLVRRFREKPSSEEAAELYRDGALWNTMIVVARAAALWDIARAAQPAMMERFEALRPWFGRAEEAEAVALAYRGMPGVNFSRDIIEPAADWTVTLPMDGVRWSDWGRPGRILETLDRIGGARSFPAELLGDVPASAAAPRPLAGPRRPALAAA